MNNPTQKEALEEKVRQLMFRGDGKEVAELRLDSEGRWWFEGDEVTHLRVRALFNGSLVALESVDGGDGSDESHGEVGRSAGKGWVLSVGRYVYPVVVEDTALFVEGIAMGEKKVALLLSNGQEAALDLSTVTYEGTGKLYCVVDGVKARFKHGAYHRFLGECLVEKQGKAVIVLGDQWKSIGDILGKGDLQ